MSSSSAPEEALRIYRLRPPVQPAVPQSGAAPQEGTWVLQSGERFHELSAASVAALVRAGGREFPLAPSELRPWTEAPPLVHPRGLDLPLLGGRPGKILALGRNFRAHAAELGVELPEEPLFFGKLPETLVPCGSTVGVPAWYTARLDHEAELAVCIGRGGREIPEERALEHVLGYTVANDLTLRSLQKADREKQLPWFRGKNFDGACPLGPCFVPRQQLDLSDLQVSARVRHADGREELRQDANTRDFVTGVPQAIAWLSRHLTLHAGDLILMGTPAGVGPLVDGDLVICAVAGIGELHTRIARPS